MGGEELLWEGCGWALPSPLVVLVAGIRSRARPSLLLSSELCEAWGGRPEVSSLESTSSTLISVSVSESSGPRRGWREGGECDVLVLKVLMDASRGAN